MSAAASRAVWDNGKARGTAFQVLLALADFAQDWDWSAWPKVENLAAKARVSKRTAQEAIKSLEKGGEIVRLRDGGQDMHGRNVTAMWQIRVQPSYAGPQDPDAFTLRGVQDPHPGGAEIVEGGVQISHPDRTKERTEELPSGAREDLPLLPAAELAVLEERALKLCRWLFGKATTARGKAPAAKGESADHVATAVKLLAEHGPEEVRAVAEYCFANSYWASKVAGINGLVRWWPEIRAQWWTKTQQQAGTHGAPRPRTVREEKMQADRSYDEDLLRRAGIIGGDAVDTVEGTVVEG